jgi:hypothetical protein
MEPIMQTFHESKAFFTVDLAIGSPLLLFAPDAAADNFNQDALKTRLADVTGSKL